LNEIFQRGWGRSVCHTVENLEGWGVISFPQKMENPGRRGVISGIPSVVGVWIFSETTHITVE